MVIPDTLQIGRLGSFSGCRNGQISAVIKKQLRQLVVNRPCGGCPDPLIRGDVTVVLTLQGEAYPVKLAAIFCDMPLQKGIVAQCFRVFQKAAAGSLIFLSLGK